MNDGEPKSNPQALASLTARIAALLPHQRTGSQTSEFWVVLLIILIATLGGIGAELPAKYAAVIDLISAVAYGVLRTWSKSDGGDQILELVDSILAIERELISSPEAAAQPAAPVAEVRATGTTGTTTTAVSTAAAVVMVAVLFSFSGCAVVTSVSNGVKAKAPQISATAQYALQKTATLAAGAVLNAAVSEVDGQAKGNVVDGLAYGLRTQEGSLLTSDDVKNLVAIWTPQKPHWAELGAQLATAYDQAHPQTPAAASSALEALATGLNTATAGSTQP